MKKTIISLLCSWSLSITLLLFICTSRRLCNTCKERRNLTSQGTMYTLVSHVVSFALVIKTVIRVH